MTTDALRKQAVEAMAQAMWRLDHGLPPLMTWDELDDFVKTTYRNKATAALDAALDVLGERMEDVDWQTRFTATIPGLLAALRAGKSRIDDPAGKGSDE